MRWDIFYVFGEFLVSVYVYGPVFALCRRWILTQVVIIFKIVSRPDRPRAKSAAAIRANIVQNFLNALFAESAFVATNHGVC
jgi:hypothetical protein